MFKWFLAVVLKIVLDTKVRMAVWTLVTAVLTVILPWVPEQHLSEFAKLVLVAGAAWFVPHLTEWVRRPVVVTVKAPADAGAGGEPVV